MPEWNGVMTVDQKEDRTLGQLIDQVESFGRSKLQHGPLSDRVYLMKLDKADLPGILGYIHQLAIQHGYSKVFAKIPVSVKPLFEQNGYRLEAAVPNFFNGGEDGLFMARYYRPDRMLDPALERVRAVIARAGEKGPVPHSEDVCRELECRLATPLDCRRMSELYRRVFSSYPFPIDDPQYLRRTMAEDVLYAGIWQDDKLIALASAEIDRQTANAEMTDFATHPGSRGRGLAGVLLQKLELLMAETGVKTCYTIARATSYGMNITFARHQYVFAGTLINNTQISGALESMNVWYKQIDRKSCRSLARSTLAAS
jgi:putative beta-lysine N-acetyltransferase